MTVQTLAELQAQVAAEEAAAEKTAAEETDVNADESESDADVTEVEEGSTEQSDEEKTDADDDDKPEWAKPEGSVPVAKHVEMKHKLRARADAALSEAEKLRLENEQLKSQLSGGAKVEQEPLRAPRLDDEDIGYDEDKYQQRMTEYTEAVIERKLSGQSQKSAEQQQQSQRLQQIQGEVESHYERAASLVSSGTVTQENYQAADSIVRNSVASATGKDGDFITDFLISNLGEGSEKVMYHLGVNPAALKVLTEKLQSDPTGIRAATYLGEMKAKFNSAPANKLSKAPPPDKALQSKANVTSGSLKRAYEKAEQSGDVGAMVRAKRQAKAAGQDTSNW